MFYFKTDGEAVEESFVALYSPSGSLGSGLFEEVEQNSFLISELLYVYQPGPNRHIFIHLLSIWRRNSRCKVRWNYIHFERRIHVEIRFTSIRRGYFNVDSTFKIDEISMTSPRGFFYVVSMSNRHNFCTRCFHSIISSYFPLWEPILSCSGIMLGRCNFNDIDIITAFWTIGTISLGNIGTVEINRNNDKFFFLQNNTNRDYNANVYNQK